MGFILLGTDPDKNHFNAGEIWVVAFSCLWFWVKLFAICAQLYKEVGLVLLTESPLTRGW